MPLRWRRRTAKPRPADAMPADLVAWAQVVDASGLLSLGYEQYDVRLRRLPRLIREWSSAGQAAAAAGEPLPSNIVICTERDQGLTSRPGNGPYG
jgi:hypothetical protein